MKKVVILFVTVHDSLARLDCVTANGGEAGWPFSVVLSLSDDADWATGAAHRMRVWADRAEVLDLDVSGPERVRIRLSDGGKAIVFGAVPTPPSPLPHDAN